MRLQRRQLSSLRHLPSKGKTYNKIWMVNAAMNSILFFAIANHSFTIFAADGHYTKPLNVTYITISQGKDLTRYYMPAKTQNAFIPWRNFKFNKSTTIGNLCYISSSEAKSSSFLESYPNLPLYNDTSEAFRFFTKIRSLYSR